jgi:hypothetical protein
MGRRARVTATHSSIKWKRKSVGLQRLKCTGLHIHGNIHAVRERSVAVPTFQLFTIEPLTEFASILRRRVYTSLFSAQFVTCWACERVCHTKPVWVMIHSAANYTPET